MLHYVHQLVSNCVCLPFGAEQVVYCGFLEHFYWKQQQKWDPHKRGGSAQNSNVADSKMKTKSWKMLKCFLQGTAELGDNHQWVCHYKPFTYT